MLIPWSISQSESAGVPPSLGRFITSGITEDFYDGNRSRVADQLRASSRTLVAIALRMDRQKPVSSHLRLLLIHDHRSASAPMARRRKRTGLALKGLPEPRRSEAVPLDLDPCRAGHSEIAHLLVAGDSRASVRDHGGDATLPCQPGLIKSAWERTRFPKSCSPGIQKRRRG